MRAVHSSKGVIQTLKHCVLTSIRSVGKVMDTKSLLKKMKDAKDARIRREISRE